MSSVSISVKKDGWLLETSQAINGGTTVYLIVDSGVLSDVINKVHQAATSPDNPFSKLVENSLKALGPGLPPNLPVLVVPWVNAVAAVGGGSLGLLTSLSVAIAGAVLHNYRIEVGPWRINKLLDPHDDEGIIGLIAPAK